MRRERRTIPFLRSSSCPTNLQSAVVEEHHQSMLSLHPLEQQGGGTRGLLPTQKITTLEGGGSPNATLRHEPTSDWAHLRRKSSSLSHLHQVLLHVVGHQLHNLLLTVQLLREGVGGEGEVFVVGQAVVDSAVQREGRSLLAPRQGSPSPGGSDPTPE